MYLLLTDTHFGIARGGMFDSFQFATFETILDLHPDLHLIILGDLFASKGVPMSVLWRVYYTLKNRGTPITLVRGNHDVSTNTEDMSSFDFLFSLMLAEGLLYGVPGVTIIPHRQNQQQFDTAVAAVPEGGVLLTHANYENIFAIEKDHSLNLTRQQAARFKLVISGHEHNSRRVDNVYMLGSMLPYTIQEATAPKYYYLWDGDTGLSPMPIWTPDAYAEVNWQDLDAAPPAQYVRVVGEATPEQAAQVITAISKFRAVASAFVISNSVTVGEFKFAEIAETTEGLEQFDIISMFYALLPDQYAKRIQTICG